MQPDFEQLYSLLHLEPGCSLEEFQRAYRRAIAEMHPDRRETDARTAEQQSQLRDLISLHALATNFYRRHGRLPGAKPSKLAPSSTVPVPLPVVGDRSPPGGGASNRRWLMLIVLLAFVVWQLAGQSLAPVPEEPAPSAATDVDAPLGLGIGQYLALGMDPKTVLAIQGEPEQRGATEWRYGSSWLRFDNERLVDWYSSPFNRLRTQTATPPAK